MLRHLILLILLIGVSFSAHSDQRMKPFPQRCTGYLRLDPTFGELQLANTPNDGNFAGVSWCDAFLEEPIKSYVLTICSVGDKCKINGLVSGHGVFSWVEVTKVEKISIDKIVNSKPQQNSEKTKSDLDFQNLVSEWYKLNHKCKGGSGDDPKTFKACKSRDSLEPKLEKLGGCYGKETDGSSSKIIWKKCDSSFSSDQRQ